MTTLPTTLAMIAASLTATALFADHNADFNNDGFVDANDLLIVSSNLNTACDGECPSDLNHDGMTDLTDLMLLMGQWGPVPGYVAEETEEEEDVPPPTRDPNRDMSWQGQDPVLLDAIYYDHLCRGGERKALAEELDQGSQAKAWASENGVAVQPISYNGAVDWYEDGEYSDDDKERFKNWLDEQVPADYDGPICLDLEGTWWNTLNTSNQAVMDIVLDFYIEGLEYAKSLRPNAKIGYWGIPKKRYTSEDSSEHASIERLLIASTGIFPDVYEWSPNADDASRLQVHVEKCIELVKGEVPVYVQAFPRYKLGSNSPLELHAQEEFIHDQVQAALDAVWTDADGVEHRISGVALWDAYFYATNQTDGWSEMTSEERKAVWDELDGKHVEILTGMKLVVDLAVEATIERQELAEQLQAEAEAAAAQEAAAALRAERIHQRSRLLNQWNFKAVKLARSSRSYRKSSQSYQLSRKSWPRAKRIFAKAKRQYRRGSRQYKRALAQYTNAKRNVQSAARSFRKNRTTYRKARATINTARKQWRVASAQWAQMEEEEQSLLN